MVSLNDLHCTSYRTLPMLNVILKRFGRNCQVQSAAVKIETLQDEEIEEIPPPLCLMDQIDLITGVTPHDTMSDQIHRAQVNLISHAPVVRYTIENCVVSKSGVEFFGGSLRIRNLRINELISKPLREEPYAHYAMSPVAHRYFGHFLRDACPTALLSQPNQLLFLDCKPDWPDSAVYASAFDLRAAAPGDYLIRQLTTCADFSQGSLKRERYRELRRRIAKVYGPRGEGKDTVYLRRGSTGVARVISDEDRVAEVMSARGYRIVPIYGSSVAELACELSAARRVITMEGSHLNHVYYLSPQGVDVCVLMPADRATFTHRFVTHAFGGRFGYLVCPRVGNSYRIDVDQLERTIELFD